MRQIRKYQKDKGRILNSNRLLYHSLPIGCILALLLLGCSLLNPAGFGNGISNGMNDSLGSMGSSNKAYADSNEEEGISTLANGDNISLSISGDVNAAVTAGTDKPVFRSHTVTASASNIESYSLTIKYDTGSTSLKNSTAGATIIKDLSTNTVGSNIPDNTWGWGWSDSTTTADTAMTYQAMSTSDKVIKSSTNPTNNAANISGKLAFGAKFAEGATAGHYQANVLVSFAIKPQEVATIPFNGITTMQEMTEAICRSASPGATGKLQDTRDGKLYWVSKTAQNYSKCWMAQNLDYDGGGTKYSLGDVRDDEDNFYYDLGERYCHSGNCNQSTSSNDGHDAVGNYYSWAAATNSTSTAGGGSAGINATGSVCPTGWYLPGNYEYAYLDGIASAQITGLPYYFVLSGGISNSILDSSVGATGKYWTSTVDKSSSGQAYYGSVTSSAVTRVLGAKTQAYPIRCVSSVCRSNCEPLPE